ncbi:MAG: methionyl-tRNA formyltransferase [Desulfocapsaceae bacterium]|nr:methionyl-tRNA formyltransferase [Desulfocapsaceae bacterium]
MKTFRILFMGTPEFAVPVLKSLVAGPDEVVAVVTQPDREKGRGKRMSPPPVKTVALTAGIPVLQPARIKTQEFRDCLAGYRPDLAVVVAYGRILPPALLEIPPLGCLNVHGSLLPQYRGAAPIQWAVIKGETEVGVTVMRMDEGMDTGDILLPARLTAAPDETAGSLFAKLADLGAATLQQALDLLRRDALRPIPQDHSQASTAPMLSKEHGLMDWSRPAAELHCWIRGLDPWPTAYSFLAGKRFRFFAPEVVPAAPEAPPGTLLRADREGLLIATGCGSLLIREVQPEGGKRMKVEAYICGHPLQPGISFG